MPTTVALLDGCPVSAPSHAHRPRHLDSRRRPRGSLRAAAGWMLCLLGSLLSGGPLQAAERAPSVTPRSSEPSVDVLIVGGGLSGLCTAYYLKQAGLSFQLLEAAPRVGGRVRTATYPGGLRAEAGLAELWEGNPAIEIAQALRVPLERGEATFSSLVLDGKLVPFVQETNEAFLRAALGDIDYRAFRAWDEKMQSLARELEPRPLSEKLMALQALSFGKWLEEQKLPARVLAVVRATLEPEIGTALESISALDGVAEWRIFSARGAAPHHVLGGNQRLTEALASHVGRSRIRLNTQVTAVQADATGVLVSANDTATFRNSVYRAKAVVLAIPLYRLLELHFTPRLSAELYQAIQSQSWGAYFTAHVRLDRAAEKLWTVGGHSILPILAGSSPGVIYGGHSEVPSKEALLDLLVYGAAAEGFNARTGALDEVREQLEKALEGTLPGIRPHIRGWTFYRYHPRAIAAWPVGRSRFDALSEALRRPFGALYFAGDFTESSHSDGAALAARRVSRQLVERLAPGIKPKP